MIRARGSRTSHLLLLLVFCVALSFAHESLAMASRRCTVLYTQSVGLGRGSTERFRSDTLDSDYLYLRFEFISFFFSSSFFSSSLPLWSPGVCVVGMLDFESGGWNSSFCFVLFFMAKRSFRALS
uniref:Secreted protein n=1 Tax=Cacopsylla melanoneura TaxID=428564 RepID=A0A8D8T0W5_9HEMI